VVAVVVLVSTVDVDNLLLRGVVLLVAVAAAFTVPLSSQASSFPTGNRLRAGEEDNVVDDGEAATIRLRRRCIYF
jgi:hypothetical protein